MSGIYKDIVLAVISINRRPAGNWFALVIPEHTNFIINPGMQVDIKLTILF